MYYLRVVERIAKKKDGNKKIQFSTICVKNTCLGSWYNKIMPESDNFADAAKECGEKSEDLCCIIVSGQTDNPIPILDYLTFKKRNHLKEDSSICSKWEEYYIVNDYGNTYERLI